jgi:hypothetical protein
MASIRTTSEFSEYAGTDPFADFDGAYDIFEDERNHSASELEPSCTSSEDSEDGNERSQHRDYVAVETGEGARSHRRGEEREEHSSRMGKIKRWVRRLLRCS